MLPHKRYVNTKISVYRAAIQTDVDSKWHRTPRWIFCSTIKTSLALEWAYQLQDTLLAAPPFVFIFANNWWLSCFDGCSIVTLLEQRSEWLDVSRWTLLRVRFPTKNSILWNFREICLRDFTHLFFLVRGFLFLLFCVVWIFTKLTNQQSLLSSHPPFQLVFFTTFFSTWHTTTNSLLQATTTTSFLSHPLWNCLCK